jgi:amidase
MTRFKEYHQYDAMGLSELIQKKQISPEELCSEAMSRIKEWNPKINAVIHTFFEKALEKTRTSDLTSPFAGVPFLLKDLEQPYAGEPMSSGSRALKNSIPEKDSELVKRFKEAGLVTLGKTNTPEFGLTGFTEPDAFGATRNPWDLNRTPGGSSGGSGAAVAARVVPVASAGDGGGSIRIPASACGIFGLKPSRGRVPCGPGKAELWDGAASHHVLSLSVRDSAAILDWISGPEAGAPYTVQRPERPYFDETQKAPRKLKIGFSVASPLRGEKVDPECQDAVHEAARLLESLGHFVEEVKAPVDGDSVAQAYLMMYFGQVAADLRELRKSHGNSAARNQVEPTTRLLGQIGDSLSSGEYVEKRRSWNLFSRQMAKFHENYDLYLTPTLASLPVPIGSLKPSAIESKLISVANSFQLGRLLVWAGVVNQIALRNLSKTPFTQLANLTGQPAMSVPLHWTKEDLPAGVHFMAPSGDEATLFQLASELEQARPWFSRRPRI